MFCNAEAEDDAEADVADDDGASFVLAPPTRPLLNVRAKLPGPESSSSSSSGVALARGRLGAGKPREERFTGEIP